MEDALYQTAPVFERLPRPQAVGENGCCEKLVFQ